MPSRSRLSGSGPGSRTSPASGRGCRRRRSRRRGRRGGRGGRGRRGASGRGARAGGRACSGSSSSGLGGGEGEGDAAARARGEEQRRRVVAQAGRRRRPVGLRALGRGGGGGGFGHRRLGFGVGRRVGRAEAVRGAFFDRLAADRRAVDDAGRSRSAPCRSPRRSRRRRVGVAGVGEQQVVAGAGEVVVRPVPAQQLVVARRRRSGCRRRWWPRRPRSPAGSSVRSAFVQRASPCGPIRPATCCAMSIVTAGARSWPSWRCRDRRRRRGGRRRRPRWR